MEKRRNRKKKKNYKYTKYKIYVFSAVLMLMTIIALIIPLRPKESKVEKRTLTKFPAFSVQSFLNGEFLNGISTWYADTFPFREALLTGNTRYRGLYGIQDNQIHGSIQTADEVPAKRISLMDIVLPNIQQEMDSLQESIQERIETQRAADAANGGAKRRQITNVPEQVGSVYVMIRPLVFMVLPRKRPINILMRSVRWRIKCPAT